MRWWPMKPPPPVTTTFVDCSIAPPERCVTLVLGGNVARHFFEPAAHQRRKMFVPRRVIEQLRFDVRAGGRRPRQQLPHDERATIDGVDAVGNLQIERAELRGLCGPALAQWLPNR